MMIDTRPVLLLVDDEPLNLQVLRQILQEEYRLLFAKDGIKALELATKEQPALILLDVMMPYLSGHDVCRRLKQNPLTMNIPVIFVTALAEDVDEAQGFDAGAVDYITKPVSPLVVRARIRTQLDVVLGFVLHISRPRADQNASGISQHQRIKRNPPADRAASGDGRRIQR